MVIYLILLLSIFSQSVTVYSFLLKCETIPEETINTTHDQESVNTGAIDNGAVITTYDDYNISTFGIHKLHKTAETWNSARNICLDEKAQLAVINSAGEEALIIKLLKEHNIFQVWIGVHDLFEKNQWTTVTGERLYSLGYVHWSKNEPNNLGSNEHCVHISQTGMNDIICTREFYFLCEKTKYWEM